MADFDVVVIGSGFGGAVTACRLAQSGAKVLVLERGRRWSPENFPRALTDPWLFSHRCPHKFNGWLDLRIYPKMMILLGAAVGGGSLSYAGVLVQADPENFMTGWPPEITGATLAPYYAKAQGMLKAQFVPKGQETPRAHIMRRAAEALNFTHRLNKVELGITFDEDYSDTAREPLSTAHSKPFVNGQGLRQGTCVHLGNCQIGCDVLAKNTLDLNYLAAAEQRGADIRALHVVRSIEPNGNGYRVHYGRIAEGRLRNESVTAERVVLAAGSLGSTEILLRCRDEHKTLPNISAALGSRWSANANVMTSAYYPKSVPVRQGIGPMISHSLTFMDGKEFPHQFMIEEDGLPNIFLNVLAGHHQNSWLARLFKLNLHRGYDEWNPMGQQMKWLGAGIDAGDGKIELKREFFAPWRKHVSLQWSAGGSHGLVKQILAVHTALSKVEAGPAVAAATWTYLRMLNTVHPLGGCAMGADAGNAVVDHRGEVFGHKNLFVLDGAIVPKPIGRNPSLTIAALAERGAELMLK